MIDLQSGFDEPRWGERNNPDAEANAAALLDAWRAADRPRVHVRHAYNRGRLAASTRPTRIRVQTRNRTDGRRADAGKSVNSCFIGTDLEARLREWECSTLVLAGLTTDHCVSTTARMAENLGFRVYVVADATATFDRTGPDGTRYSTETMHETALTHLHGEFAAIVTTADVLTSIDEAG